MEIANINKAWSNQARPKKWDLRNILTNLFEHDDVGYTKNVIHTRYNADLQNWLEHNK